MRLKTVFEGVWRVVAPMDADGSCDLMNELEALAANPRTEATAAKFAYVWRQIPQHGPHALPDGMYHLVDDKNEIYEFIGKRHRVLCFLADGRVVICSHMFMKKTPKTPKAEKKRAIAIRNQYLEAKRLGQLEIEEGGQ